MSDIRKPINEYNEKSTYILGLDLARTGKDETSFVILEQLSFDKNIFVVFIETLNTPDLMDAIGRAEYLDNIFHFKKVIIDETGLGAGVVDILKRKLPGRVEGIWYTQKSKAEMFTNLKLLMSGTKVKLYIPDYITMTNPVVRKMFYQFLSITREYKEGSMLPKISHEKREHDDIINAMCLAATYFNFRSMGGKRYFLAGGNRV